MTRTTSLMVCLSLFSATAASADGMIQVGTSAGVDSYGQVSITQAAVDEAMAAPGTQVTRVSEREAIEAAAVRGVHLTPTSRRSREWGHPWVIIKAGVGLPGLAGADIEIYVHDHWTIEGGGAVSLGANIVTAGVHWRPEATCFGCHGANMFSIGFGLDNSVLLANSQTDILIAATTDAQYIHRFAEHFGWVIGLKVGLGATTGFYNTGNGSSSGNVPPPIPPAGTPNPSPSEQSSSTSGSLKIEPALEFFLYTGFSF